MESIGQILKAARARRQISIADVAAATKMSSTFVQAIEADDFAVLVAPIYARGFIKLYAECVGVDPVPLLKQFGVSGRASPAPYPPAPQAPPEKISVAEKLKPPCLQQSGPLPSHGAPGKPEQEKAGARSKAGGGAVLAETAPFRALARAPAPSLASSWSTSLRAMRLSALKRMFGVCAQWPRIKLPARSACKAVCSMAGRIFQCLAFPAIVWRRISILSGVVLLIVAASVAWEWSQRGLPSTPDACRWLADPPAPYLTMEISATKLNR